MVFLSLPRSGVEDINLPEPCDGATVADRIRLGWLALAVILRAIQFVCSLSTESVAGVPEIRGPRLIGHVAQHFAQLAILDLVKCLAPKLEIVALLVNGPATVAQNKNAVLHIRDQIFE